MKFEKGNLVLSLTRANADESTIILTDNVEDTWILRCSHGFAVDTFLRIVEHATHPYVVRGEQVLKDLGYEIFQQVSAVKAAFLALPGSSIQELSDITVVRLNVCDADFSDSASHDEEAIVQAIKHVCDEAAAHPRLQWTEGSELRDAIRGVYNIAYNC